MIVAFVGTGGVVAGIGELVQTDEARWVTVAASAPEWATVAWEDAAAADLL